MNSLTPLMELDFDSSTRLQLAVDANDPPRFYVLDHRNRVELIAIRDAELARDLFLRRVAQQLQRRTARRDRISRMAAMRSLGVESVNAGSRHAASALVGVP